MAANGNGGGATAPPLAPPPGILAPDVAPAQAGKSLGASRAGANLHQEIARDIGQQVESMILQAKRSSETKVVAEIQKIKAKIESMNEKIKIITERVNRLDPTTGAILKADLQKNIAQLEDVWEGEVGAMKHELWQTIQAHNHNADLMKHHKDAIDQIRNRMQEVPPNTELMHVHGQLMQVDKLMQKEQAKQHQIDQFMQRLTIVQTQLNASLEAWQGGVPFSVPGAGVAAGRPPASMTVAAAAAAANAAGGKKVQKKGAAKPTKATKGGMGALSNSLRAEAPEFVPTTSWDD